jgi:hypothetical protein
VKIRLDDPSTVYLCHAKRILAHKARLTDRRFVLIGTIRLEGAALAG